MIIIVFAILDGDYLYINILMKQMCVGVIDY